MHRPLFYVNAINGPPHPLSCTCSLFSCLLLPLSFCCPLMFLSASAISVNVCSIIDAMLAVSFVLSLSILPCKRIFDFHSSYHSHCFSLCLSLTLLCFSHCLTFSHSYSFLISLSLMLYLTISLFLDVLFLSEPFFRVLSLSPLCLSSPSSRWP